MSNALFVQPSEAMKQEQATWLKRTEDIPHQLTPQQRQREEREQRKRERRARRELEVITAAGEELAAEVGMVRSLDCVYPQPDTPADGVAWWRASVLANLRGFAIAKPKFDRYKALRDLGPLSADDATVMHETWRDLKELTRVLANCGFTPAPADPAAE